MGSWVLSECGFKPLPQLLYHRPPRSDFTPQSPRLSISTPISWDLTASSVKIPSRSLRDRTWRVGVSAPLRVEEKAEDEKPIIDGGGSSRAAEFNPGAPPPKHCWVKDPWRSMSYVVRDVAVVLGLAVAAAYLNNWAVWPLYWAAQGTMFCAFFVLGHDCGHGSFSNYPNLNSVVGHLLHSSILVPYHGWRISHRTHHQNHGHVENDESWHPLPEKIYRRLDNSTRTLRFTVPFPMLAYSFYLWSRSPGKTGSHFDPSSDLFAPSERKAVITSTLCGTARAGLLLGLSCVMGPIQLLKLYGVPYWIFVMWLDFVTCTIMAMKRNSLGTVDRNGVT